MGRGGGGVRGRGGGYRGARGGYGGVIPEDVVRKGGAGVEKVRVGLQKGDGASGVCCGVSCRGARKEAEGRVGAGGVEGGGRERGGRGGGDGRRGWVDRWYLNWACAVGVRCRRKKGERGGGLDGDEGVGRGERTREVVVGGELREGGGRGRRRGGVRDRVS